MHPERAKVLVHGVPETSDVWTPLIDELAALGLRDVVRLSPPGFGAPMPGGFGATLDGYQDWLIAELSRFDAPVDLVGHDFGGVHTMNVAMGRPDLLHSWTTDTVGLFASDYVWHPTAQTWQTPGDGEQNIKEVFGGSVADRAAMMAQWGFPARIADKLAAAQGDEMGRAILALYRSAAQPALAGKGRDLPAAAGRPGLALMPTEDPFVGSLVQRRGASERSGARTATLDGLGHLWMVEDPAGSARVLADFWAAVDAPS
ncbi:alpha/beta fold hydrolase [Actinoplanes sp. NPDC049265]|uniref:alpha/beta fold hydrolase n=1 Tax=Actinoplanes sp. NPDC049265 TaxID=3363902 RepID=UPI00371D97CF